MAPKAIEEGKTLTAEDKFELLLDRLTTVLTARQEDGISAETIKALLDEQRKDLDKNDPRFRPYPGFGDCAYPEGDLKRPKKDLPYQLFWNGYPVYKFRETETWYEWELYAQLEPGEFTVLCKDGSPMTVKIDAERDGKGAVTKLTAEHPRSRENKHNIPPLYVVLWQIVHPSANPRKAFVEAMQKWLELSMGEPETA